MLVAQSRSIRLCARLRTCLTQLRVRPSTRLDLGFSSSGGIARSTVQLVMVNSSIRCRLVPSLRSSSFTPRSNRSLVQCHVSFGCYVRRHRGLDPVRHSSLLASRSTPVLVSTHASLRLCARPTLRLVPRFSSSVSTPRSLITLVMLGSCSLKARLRAGPSGVPCSPREKASWGPRYSGRGRGAPGRTA